MRAAVCPRCKRKRIVVRLKMTDPWKIRSHFWPGSEAIPDRRGNGLCEGSGTLMREELTVPA